MAETAPYCGQCGQPSGGGASDVPHAGCAAARHPGCLVRAELEPPRYCPSCGRRMVVQVDPMGWRAVCSRHGERRG